MRKRISERVMVSRLKWRVPLERADRARVLLARAKWTRSERSRFSRMVRMISMGRDSSGAFPKRVWLAPAFLFGVGCKQPAGNLIPGVRRNCARDGVVVRVGDAAAMDGASDVAGESNAIVKVSDGLYRMGIRS